MEGGACQVYILSRDSTSRPKSKSRQIQMLFDLDQECEEKRKWENQALAVFQQESLDILDTLHKTQSWWVNHELINPESKDFPCHNVKSV